MSQDSKASLRQRILRGERVCGALLRMPSEELVEMLAVAGFDFVLIDCEHGPADPIALRQHISAAAMHQMDVLVRVGEHEAALILRALDSGAVGIVAPHIDDAGAAVELVWAGHYPPLGNRGFATYGRAGQYGKASVAEHKARFAEDTLLIAMIESPAAVSAVEEIVAVPGIDGVLIGAADLAASSSPADPTIQEAREQVNKVLARTGALRMDLVGDAESATAAYAQGAQMVVYNLTQALMAQFTSLQASRPNS